MTEDELNNLDSNEELQDEFSLVKHSVKHKQTERKIRKKRKKINRIKGLLRFIVLLILLFLIYKFFTLSGWYLPEDTFQKAPDNRIEIINNKIVPDYVIKNSLKKLASPKLPIFLMKVEPVKKEIFKIPVIKNMYVRRYGFPARIQIIVRERTPIAVIKTDLKAKPVAFFTSDGILITNKHYMNLAESEPVLKILTTYANLNKDISVEKIRYIEKIVKAVETYSNEKVEYIDMRNKNDVYVKIQTTSIRLGTLDSSVFERIKRIYTILPQISDVDGQIRYIDLSWDNVNYLKLKKSK